MQVVSFMNMKGGVGKTTLAVNVAYGLAYIHKKKILLIDADPQFNASQYLMEEETYLQHVEDATKGTLRDIFLPKRPGPIKTVPGPARRVNKTKMDLDACTCSIFDGGEGRGRLDLIPSTLNLMDLQESNRLTETRLGSYLQEKAKGYDYVIIDCPPTISFFTQAAILASDMYLVPIKPDPLSIVGLPLLERWLDDFTEDAGKDLTYVGLVYTLVRGPIPARMQGVMDQMRRQRTNEVFSAYLSEATDVAKSVESHLPIFLHKKAGKSTEQILQITAEFLSRIQQGDQIR